MCDDALSPLFIAIKVVPPEYETGLEKTFIDMKKTIRNSNLCKIINLQLFKFKKN